MNSPGDGMKSLPDSACWDLLGSAGVGRLAVCIAGRPDVFPVNYVVDDRSIVFRTAEGTKLAGALFGASVAFEVDHWDAEVGVAWSVVARGPATEIGSIAELLAAEDLPLFPWHASPSPRHVRIRPDEVSGRRFEIDDSTGTPNS